MSDHTQLPEAERNRLLRRVDWRFLLPNPRPVRTGCFGDRSLQRAVTLISDEVVVGHGLERGDCDLTVAVNPRTATLQRVWATLLPGGRCYLELRGMSYAGMNRVRRRLKAIGFDEIRFHFAWPVPSRAPAQFWLPLDSQQALRYFLRSRSIAQPVRRRLGLAVRWIALRLAVRSSFPLPVCVTARRPERDQRSVTSMRNADSGSGSDVSGARRPTADLDALVQSTCGSATPASRPGRTRWIMLTGGARSVGKVVGLVFFDDATDPQLAVKMARVPESAPALKREACILTAIHLSGNLELHGIPEVRFCSDEHGVVAVGETILTGQPLYTQVNDDTYRELALKATDWLVQLAGDSERTLRAKWWRRLVETALSDFVRNFGQVVSDEHLRRTREILDTLPNLPLVCEQRDFSPWNVLLDRHGELAVLDWESAERRGLPLTDLIYFITYLGFFHRGAMESGRFVDAYREILDPSTFIGGISDECIRSYCERVGLGSDVVKPLRILTWMLHSRSDYRHFSADIGGAPGPDALEGSVFIRLWKEEMRLSDARKQDEPVQKHS